MPSVGAAARRKRPAKGMDAFPREGLIGVWKPKGMSSHDAVNIVRRLSGERRVGHAGTLDPLASGVLVMGIGRASTKQLGDAVAKEKEYVATVRLGAESSTGDEEGEKVPVSNPAVPSRDALDAVMKKFIGRILQVPPIYSALKVKGRTAYSYARAGEAVELAAREVDVKEIEVVSYAWPDMVLRVVTGPGAYIRSLARDIGRALGVGGYLTGLIRTRVGEYDRSRCVMIAEAEGE